MKKITFAALAALGLLFGSMATAIPGHAAASHYGSSDNAAPGGNA